MQAIITGISFLGAGTIIFADRRNKVEGLTTAASILFVSGLGMAVAIGRLFLAVILTIFVFLILFFIGRTEHWFSKRFTNPVYRNEEKNDSEEND
jgi:putative Mg2+ transporter-C (MgtC) family protein